MTPLDDLVDAVFFTFEEGFHRPVASVPDPAHEPQPVGHLLSVLAEEDALDASFDDHPCPGLLHLAMKNIISPFRNQWEKE